MFTKNHIDRVDWTVIERHYSQYSVQELEEMTYPKQAHGWVLTSEYSRSMQFDQGHLV